MCVCVCSQVHHRKEITSQEAFGTLVQLHKASSLHVAVCERESVCVCPRQVGILYNNALKSNMANSSIIKTNRPPEKLHIVCGM